MWEQSINNFVPDDLTTFVVPGSSSIVFYENFQNAHLEISSLINGAYYVSGSQGVDIVIQDPNRDIVFMRKGETKGIIEFNSTI